MSKYIFKNDYAEGAHQKVLDALIKANSDTYDGYGHDHITKEAIEIIRKEIGQPDASVNFISGGTQTNLIAIKAFLKPHEAVISADIGHINVQEGGSIESTGHKIIQVTSKDGKLTPAIIENEIERHLSEHMVVPKMVYLSNTMENGLVYTKAELEAISKVCKKNKLFFFLDGARLAQALDVLDGTLTLKDIARLTDVFYIGGTKNGLLYGECLIITNEYAKDHIRFVMKQTGAVLSKTWAMAVQFRAVFEDGLFYELGKNGNDRAREIYEGLSDLGIEFYEEFGSNQIFPIFPNYVLNKLSTKYVFQPWEFVEGDRKAVRIATSYCTPKEIVEALIEDTKNILENK